MPYRACTDSVRGASGNRRPYRDGGERLGNDLSYPATAGTEPLKGNDGRNDEFYKHVYETTMDRRTGEGAPGLGTHDAAPAPGSGNGCGKRTGKTRKDGAPGIDGATAADYEKDLEANLEDLLGRIKSGRYKAPPVRRHYIPKADGTQRPLGIPTFEDKVAQRAIVMLLEPVYEADFLPCSHGFRPGRSAHDALHAVREGIHDGMQWVIDMDISNYFVGVYGDVYVPQGHGVVRILDGLAERDLLEARHAQLGDALGVDPRLENGLPPGAGWPRRGQSLRLRLRSRNSPRRPGAFLLRIPAK